MVTFELESITSDKAVYKYFPENHRESAYGVFSISLVNGDVVLEVVAEEDHLCRTSASELNAMRDAINEMRAENGEPPLTEEEWPIETEDIGYYWYADHAIDVISDAYNKDGTVIKQGSAHWY
jgi:hypothetical protein